MNNNRTEEILGYSILKATAAECVKEVAGWLRKGETGKYFACANPHSLMIAEVDDCFSLALHSADILTPDGVGIILASKIMGGEIRERVTGSDVFTGLSSILNECGGFSFFFLGATEKTLAKIKTKLAIDYPNIRYNGSYSPPYKLEFTQEDNETMIKLINMAKPNVLWVGMTAPKQEKWIYLHRDKLEVNFIGAIGAVFDFYSGNVKRSPPIFQRLGLEWFPRLLQEPHRLWRRNFISGPQFMLRVINYRLKYRKIGSENDK